MTCPPGHWCALGASMARACPAGRYGATPGLRSSECTGFCDAGYYCTEGSTSSTAGVCRARHIPANVLELELQYREHRIAHTIAQKRALIPLARRLAASPRHLNATSSSHYLYDCVLPVLSQPPACSIQSPEVQVSLHAETARPAAHQWMGLKNAQSAPRITIVRVPARQLRPAHPVMPSRGSSVTPIRRPRH
jgi:hypothetical protein